VPIPGGRGGRPSPGYAHVGGLHDGLGDRGRAPAGAPGDGVIGSLVTLIRNGVTTSVSQEAVCLPGHAANYPSSVAQGDSAIKRQIAADAANCPDGQFVLAGYSQCAQVAGDAQRLNAAGIH